MTHYTTLGAIAELLKGEDLLVSADPQSFDKTTPVTGVSCNSQDVSEGQIFICKGANFKTSYLTQALEKGASGYVCAQELAHDLQIAAPDAPQFCVNDIRHAMALVSAAAWGHPEDKLRIVGVTGSKGKTTTTYMLRSIIDASTGAKSGLLGSVEYYDGVEAGMSSNTTPEAPELFHRLANAAASGLTMVMEVSSQGLKYERLLGVTFDIAAITNIGRDHISPVEHPTLEDYIASKLMIFDGAAHAVIGLDTEHLPRIAEAAKTCGDIKTYSGSYRGEAPNTTPDFWASKIEAEQSGTRFVAHTPQGDIAVYVSMPGLFNVDNALCAIALAQELGVDDEAIQKGLAEVSVPGRMDTAESASGDMLAIVDFAHNGQSFEKFFESIDVSYSDYFVITVFGCTGVKGLERRTQMPPVACAHSDLCIYTEDDPGTEDLQGIFKDMLAASPEDACIELVDNRTEAIYRAVALGDVEAQQGKKVLVCVLGKGEENRMLRAKGAEPCEMDLDIVSRAIAERDQANS